MSQKAGPPGLQNCLQEALPQSPFARHADIIKKADMPGNISLVFGYSQQTPETIQAALDACIRKKASPSAGCLLPQPGSVLYEYAKEYRGAGDKEQYLLGLGDRQDLEINLTSHA